MADQLDPAEMLKGLRQSYFMALPGYATVQDRNLKIIEANERFVADFGSVEGRHCYQVYKQRAEPCEVCPVAQTFRDGQSHFSEEKVTCTDGREVSVITYTTPIRDAAGEINAVLEMSTDITELKRLQRQLREGQDRYRLLFEEVPCYISIQDRDFRIVDANRQFREDFGNQLGCHCYAAYKRRDEVCIPCPVEKTFMDGQVHRSEEVLTARDGQQRNVLVYTAPLKDATGEVTRVMEMSTNITPIRELQSQLESVGLLIGSISHGIKGLLTGLDGGIYLVNSGLKKKDDKRLEQGWEMVQRNVERIRGMVQNILYYAKEREPNREEISPVELATEVCDLLAPKAAELGIDFKRNLPPNVSGFSVDVAAIRAMLVNLVENSIDGCRVDKKKNQHWIQLGVRENGDAIVIELEDNGIGMDQETRDKAFSLFFSSKGAKGTGLGLFIANKIAHAHGGSIELESERDKGARFMVKIPKQPVDVA